MRAGSLTAKRVPLPPIAGVSLPPDDPYGGSGGRWCWSNTEKVTANGAGCRKE